MYEDGFGCLHTKDIFGHKMRVYPFAKKYPFTCICTAQYDRTFEGKSVISASFPRSLQQVSKGAQRMMKGCSKVAYAFVTLLKNYSSAANTSTAQFSFLNFLQRYNKYLKYTRILAIKCNFICILCYKALLFAQLCDCIFGGFLIYKGVPTIQQIFVYFFFEPFVH